MWSVRRLLFIAKERIRVAFHHQSLCEMGQVLFGRLRRGAFEIGHIALSALIKPPQEPGHGVGVLTEVGLESVPCATGSLSFVERRTRSLRHRRINQSAIASG
jgi:hypothetical protein